jgi:FkbM family methyltransferase
LRIFVSTKDFRGPSFFLMYGGPSSFRRYENNSKHEIVSRLPEDGGVFLDIGGNIGLFSLYAEKEKSNVRAILFEPHPILSDCLKRTIAYNKLEKFSCVNQALSSKPGKMTFFIDAINDGGHSLIKNQIDDMTGMIETPVEVTTLDDVVKKQGLERIDAIKIDVQGAENLVLLGGTESLEKFQPPILIECENVAIDREDSLLNVLKNLKSAKYFVKRVGIDEKLTLDELVPIAKKLHEEGILYEDFLFFCV